MDTIGSDIDYIYKSQRNQGPRSIYISLRRSGDTKLILLLFTFLKSLGSWLLNQYNILTQLNWALKIYYLT